MRLLTLLSDFGADSPYPAAMKAVVTARVEAVILDISHDVPRHDVRAGAFLLASLVPYCPAGTVHLAVVDPGVGTSRRALILFSGGQAFVGPDNGLLLPAARRVGR
ncbi:MAG: SAM hydrolase/SAM-dependent halogenase family protein, partial [Actinomycetota bacterium]